MSVGISPKDGSRFLHQAGSALALRSTIGTVGTVESTIKQRTMILAYWRELRGKRGDNAWLDVINRAEAAEVDLNFPTPDGETILYKAAEHRYVRSVRRLLELEVDPNLKVTVMGNDYGNTALHMLASGLRAGKIIASTRAYNKTHERGVRKSYEKAVHHRHRRHF